MYEIEVCYKIIFEAMLEKPVLKSIAEKINEYTGAKVIFVSGTGKILAYSHTCEQDGSETIRNSARKLIRKNISLYFNLLKQWEG